MSGFAADWLALREPFDTAARNRDLVIRFAAALGTNSIKNRPVKNKPHKKLIDLGAGTGANFRFLAPLIGGDQDWLLIDHDPLLLATQIVAIADWATQAGWHYEIAQDAIAIHTGIALWRVRGQALDLATALETVDLRNVDGVTTTAFLDLVSASWLDRLALWLAAEQCPLLATLTVDGRRVWLPTWDGDAVIDDAFRRHQAGDKGFGAALGNDAASYLAERLIPLDYEASIARSDWQIGATHAEMLEQMASEAAAVAIVTVADADIIHAWLNHRRAQIAQGRATFTVGHQDLLCLPRRNRLR